MLTPAPAIPKLFPRYPVGEDVDLPEDDVGIELMNATFRDMGILVMTDDGYRVAPEFVARMEKTLAERVPDASPDEPRYREALIEELHSMGVPSGFEGIIANWLVHEVRQRDWGDE